jgi:N-acetylmuramoyl-L-alanine amidase
MKKAFIIGHNEKAQGAYSEILKVTEWGLYKSLTPELSELGDVYIHDASIGGYTARMKDTASKINSQDYDLVVALHFNMFNGKALGCEALFISEKGRVFGSNFCHYYTESTGTKNRGAKKVERGGRGFEEIFNPKAPAILVEPFFGDSESDCKLFNKEKLIESLNCL